MAHLYEGHKRILVTGGVGFIGSHLIDQLLSDGHEVLCADSLFTGTRRNIEPLFGERAFEVMRHAVTFPLYIGVDEIGREVVASSQRAFDIAKCGCRKQRLISSRRSSPSRPGSRHRTTSSMRASARLNAVLSLFQALGGGWLPPPPKGHAAQVQ